MPSEPIYRARARLSLECPLCHEPVLHDCEVMADPDVEYDPNARREQEELEP